MQEPEMSSPDPSTYKEIISDHKRCFKCLFPGCEKIIRFKSDMKRHLIIHSKVRPFVCKVPGCHKNFKRQDALKHHMETHNEDFPFPCTIPGCDSRFQKKTALLYHLEKHKNEKFFCNFPGCQRSFQTLKHLKQHQNVKTYHDKLLSGSQKCSHKDTGDFDFLNPFENWDIEQNNNIQNLSPEEHFDEDFSPKTEKFLHKETEEERGNCLKLDDFSEHTEISHNKEFSNSGKPSNIQNNDTVAMVCKYLFEENKKMKEKLAVRVDSLKAEYENHLDSMLKKALSFQFDKKNEL